MKKLLLFMVLLLVVPFATAQVNYNSDDVLYLKNGSVIRGQIVETIPLISYTINTHNGSKIFVNFDDVERITKEQALAIQTKTSSEREMYMRGDKSGRRSYGYFGSANIGASMNLRQGDGTFHLRSTNGYRFNKFVALGLETGVSIGTYGWQMPFMAHLHIDMLPSKIRPFFTLAMGINTNLVSGTYVSRGFILEPSLGLALNGFTLAIGYCGKNIVWYDSKYGGYYNRFASHFRFSIGATF